MRNFVRPTKEEPKVSRKLGVDMAASGHEGDYGVRARRRAEAPDLATHNAARRPGRHRAGARPGPAHRLASTAKESRVLGAKCPSMRATSFSW